MISIVLYFISLPQTNYYHQKNHRNHRNVLCNVMSKYKLEYSTQIFQNVKTTVKKVIMYQFQHYAKFRCAKSATESSSVGNKRLQAHAFALGVWTVHRFFQHGKE